MRPIYLSSIVAFTMAANLTGCGNEDSPSDTDAALTTDDASVSDAMTTQVVSIDFAAMVGAEPFACSENGNAKSYTNLGTANSTASIKDFRFYVSNLRLIDDSDNEVAVTLDQTSFQFEDVALLDFEDGTGGCVDLGNSALNTKITGSLPIGNYSGVAFDLAVPFDKNHLEASSVNTPSPLNIMGLFWNWQVGHKYARIDFLLEGGSGWNVHLGSTGCVSSGSAEAPALACGKPNVAKVAIPNFDPDSDTVIFDIAALVADSDLSVNLAGPPGCQSFPMDVDECTAMYPNLGMSFDTGACVDDCANQTAFKRMQ